MFAIFDVPKNLKETKKTHTLVEKYCVINRKENERER